ncbi:hypothetical protein [Profundibacterium mesophilum]|uniref:hypothetical protein n=1 Tax=Profundibacterium mesophilum TaxID=1258573 RepID=UPI00135855A8|nr:hypothetical protein [Profundibacterium mesophilum]
MAVFLDRVGVGLDCDPRQLSMTAARGKMQNGMAVMQCVHVLKMPQVVVRKPQKRHPKSREQTA